MAEYGPGLTLGRCFSYDKERIKQALNGKLLCGEDDKGFVYAPAGKAECDRYIISAFDNAVYQALHMVESGRALEAVLAKHGIKLGLREYMEALDAESKHFREDYEYDSDRDEEG